MQGFLSSNPVHFKTQKIISKGGNSKQEILTIKSTTLETVATVSLVFAMLDITTFALTVCLYTYLNIIKI